MKLHPTLQLFENSTSKGLPPLPADSPITLDTSLFWSSPLMTFSQPDQTSSIPLLASMLNVINWENEVKTQAEGITKQTNISLSPALSRRKIRKYKRHQFRNTSLRSSSKHRPMSPPPALPRLRAGEKIRVVLKK